MRHAVCISFGFQQLILSGSTAQSVETDDPLIRRDPCRCLPADWLIFFMIDQHPSTRQSSVQLFLHPSMILWFIQPSSVQPLIHIHPSNRKSIHHPLFRHASINPSIHPTTNPFVHHPSNDPIIQQLIHPSTICPTVHPSNHKPIHASMYSSIHPFLTVSPISIMSCQHHYHEIRS